MNFVYPLSFSNFANKLNLQACRRQPVIAMQIFSDHSQVKLAVLFSPACSTPSYTSALKKKHIEFPNLGSGENRTTKVFKDGRKSRFDSLACYSLTGQKNTEVFRHQSEALTAATVWNWCGKILSSGPLPPVLENVCCAVCLEPTDCPWVYQDEQGML